MRERGPWAALGLVAALIVPGCATMPATPSGVPSPMPGTGATAPATETASTPASPMPGTPVGTTASGGRITSTSPVPAVVDSQPSAEAIAVLETIREPLERDQRVPPPAGHEPAPKPVPGAVPGARADSAAPDTSAASEPGVPIPSATVPLGDRPGTLQRAGLPDSLLTPSGRPTGGLADTGAAQPGGAPAGKKTAGSETCWRVQVAAPPEAPRAQALREAAQSQLVVPMVVEHEKGRYKVRTRDCLSAEAADSFRRRATAAGFAGTFRFEDPRR